MNWALKLMQLVCCQLNSYIGNIEPQAIERAQAAGRSLWRISSTVFMHVASDNMLRPLTEYGFEENAELYPHMLTGDQVARELSALQLKKIDNINEANAAAAAAEAGSLSR